MYARSTTVRGKPQAMDDGIAYVRDKVMPAVAQMDGCVGLSMLADRETGRCVVTTSWADADALHRSAEGVVSMRAEAAEIMQGEAHVQEWEIAVLHRRHGIHHGACARVIWTQVEPRSMDRMLEAFRMSIVPRLEELPGFVGCSLMVDRTTGRCATAVTYDSRLSMAEAEPMGRALRVEFTGQTGTETTEVTVYDVVIANLRVPERV
jgi:quinol monooxygenase YgiN